jgi:YD repeat-containing protein
MTRDAITTMTRAACCRLSCRTSVRRASRKRFYLDTTGNRVWHPHQAQQDVTGNRLLKYVGTRMTFDRFGRLTEQHGFRGVTRHHYDCRHRLVRSELPDGQQVTYTYDVLNRRTSKTAHGETRYFFWHGTRLSGEMLSGRRDYRGYIYHPGSWTPLAQTHHHALMQTPQVWWYGTDTTGAPVELTDTAGETVWRAQRLAGGTSRTRPGWLRGQITACACRVSTKIAKPGSFTICTVTTTRATGGISHRTRWAWRLG